MAASRLLDDSGRTGVGPDSVQVPGGRLSLRAVDKYAWSDPQVLQGWFTGCRITVTEHVHYVDSQPSLEAWWEAMRGVPILERLRETLPDQDFEKFREDVIGLRARFADVTTDGSVNPFNRYVTCRIDLDGAES